VRALAVILVVLGVLAAPTAAQGQDGAAAGAPVPDGDVDVPSGEDRIVVAREGQPAAFTGQLFDQATALRWGNRIVRYRMRIHLLEAELTATRADYDASITARLRLVDDSYTNQLQVQRESFEREITGLRTDLHDQAARYEGELARYRNQPFWESWGFAFGMGVLVTGVIVGVLGAAIFVR
jgi:hypothetical protein